MIFRCVLETKQLEAIPLKALNGALHELLRAYQLGFHLPIFSRAVCEFMLKSCDLNATQKSLLRRIREDFTQTGAMYLKASIYCELTNVDKITKFGPSLLIPFSFINSDLVGMPGKLLVENQDSDGFVLQFCLKNVQDKIALPRCRATVCHGGGTSIAKCFQEFAKESSFTVCVSDTDQHSPDDKANKQIKRLQQIADKAPLTCLTVLPCREIENMITPDVISQLQCAVGNAWIAINDTIQKKDGNASFWHFLDLKEGLNQKRLAEMSIAARKWNEERLLHCSINTASFSLPGFGQNIVSNLQANGPAIKEYRRIVRAVSWLDHFGGLIEELGWWFAASEEVRV